MRILFISEVQWRSQISRKHLLIERLPADWEILFVSPMNARAGENSLRTRVASGRGNVRYVSLPLPKPDSGLAPVRAMTGLLSAVGGRNLQRLATRMRPDVAVCSFIWAAPIVPSLQKLGIPVVYDCNDLHYEFYPARRAEAERMFRSLVGASDEVVASSRYLREVCGRGLVIGNGVDLDTFRGREASPLPALIAESPLARRDGLVAYVGSVDDRMDFRILEGLLEALSTCGRAVGVVCLGRVFDSARGHVEELQKRYPDRVLFTGRVPYRDLPSYLSHCAVGIAPFVMSERTRAINPNKLYIYAAMEENIVTTPFSDEVTDWRDLVFIANTPDEFAAAVMKALGDDTRRRAMRERIALANSWDEKASEFARLLEQLRPPAGLR
jgi:glycosyltransferase involved in cell wall biosynthesis